jgi:UDP-N-acetylmuramate: L-alanyl-gamma-D-glutamyl-meso-diaminopimelate ligase
MKIHFIAIGGSAMHNLAIALHLKGETVTGSDDEIFDPAKSRLENYGLLPKEIGWFPEKLTEAVDTVILGMHARSDNPELIKAQALGLKIFSYPEFLYEAGKEKTRIVVGGSHGKTTITSMIIHVLQQNGIDCDYMVGAQLSGFEVMVKLSREAWIFVIEGDEYLTSPIDRRPKFHLYQPNIGIISGIAWDHINVFPTFDHYVEQFKIFAEMIPADGALIYCDDDVEVRKIANVIANTALFPYSVHPHIIKDGITYLITDGEEIPLRIFGNHNLANLNAARLACLQVGIAPKDFYKAIQTFKGASKRLELIAKNEKTAVYKDFAHSPSKLKATITAVKEQFPERELIACMELHTFSSLTETFLQEYKDSMNSADLPIIYYNPHALAQKKLPNITQDAIFKAFNNDKIKIFNDSAQLEDFLLNIPSKKASIYLMMSSGNFNGLGLNRFSENILHL